MTGKRKLPQNWQWEKLGNLFNVDKKQIDSSNPYFANLPFLGLENIEAHTRKYMKSETNQDTGESSCFLFDTSHVLYGKLRPYLNKVYLPEQNGRCSMELLPLKPSAGYSRNIVALILQSELVINHAIKHSTGGRMPRADINKLVNLRVPIPTKIEDKKQIVGKIEHKLSEIEKTRQAALRQKEAAEALQSAILREIFPFKEGDVLPDGWKWSALGRITANIQYGISKGSSQTLSGPKLLRITDIQNGNVDWSRVPYCECNDTETRRYLLQDGDIVFVRTGATTGKSFLINAPDNALFASYLIRVQCDHNFINPTYLYSFFQSPIYWNYISQGSRGGTLAGFNATMLSKMRIPYPVKRDDQISIANMFIKKMMDVEKLRLTANRQLEAIEAMPAAMLREVFDFDAGTGAAI